MSEPTKQDAAAAAVEKARAELAAAEAALEKQMQGELADAKLKPVIFICTDAPHLKFKTVQPDPDDSTKLRRFVTQFDKTQYTASHPTEIEHIRNLIRTGVLASHGVREVDRLEAIKASYAHRAEALRQNMGVQGGMHSDAIRVKNNNAALAARDAQLLQGASAAEVAAIREKMAEDGLVMTETVPLPEPQKGPPPAPNPTAVRAMAEHKAGATQQKPAQFTDPESNPGTTNANPFAGFGARK